MLWKRTRLVGLAAGAGLLLVLTGCAAEPSSTTAEDEDGAAEVATEQSEAVEPTEAEMDSSEMEGMDGSEMEGSEMEDMDMEEESFAFGEPADESEADRTITIQALDELAFDPPTVEVSDGEVITFEVENAGVLPHDFTLGDEEVQEEHAEEMAETDGEEMEHAEPNTMTVPAGETSSLTWKFRRRW